ncbi:MAG TPA: type II toxin-antitoxin system VapC family toxin [Candidatus Lokiarchaeia archaeon]|nr:type II toxin-antitoxin system VapC family toxin [Candidatus Lokiarchaeia archaeon]
MTIYDEVIFKTRDQYTLDLAFHEAGNAVRTLYNLKDLDRIEVFELASDMAGVWITMLVVKNSPLDINAILEMAIDLDIEFYDASFLFQAKKLDVVFITDDGPLQKKIPAAIKWIASTGLDEIKTNADKVL